MASSRARALGLGFFASAAVTFAPLAAEAYCRTTTAEVPASYNAATNGCYTDGLLLFWKNACVGYSIQSAASSKVPLETAKPIIDEAFGTWTAQTCSATGAAPGISIKDLGLAECAEVRYNTDGPNQNLVVFRDTTWPYNDPNNTLGLTTVTFNAETGEIYDADMEINSTGDNLSTSETVPRNGYDLLSVLTHEAGHFYGLAHAQSAASTMYASYKQGSSALRSLATDDVEGLCSIYPNAQERVVSPSVSANGILTADACDATPRHGLGSSCTEGASKPADTTTSGCAVATPAPRRDGPFAVLALLGVALIAGRRFRRA